VCISRVFLTFDDGLAKSCLRVGEYLAARGMKVAFFVVPGWINRSCTITDPFNSVGGHLTWDDCRHLVHLGHFVGSHSATHADFLECASDMINREIVDAKQAIESELQVECRGFASPFNRFTEEIASLAARVHEFVRFGPHTPSVLSRMRRQYPVYSSASLTRDVLARSMEEGFSFLLSITANGGLILQIHGFDGEGWESLPFALFEAFVGTHSSLLSGEDMFAFFRTQEDSCAPDTVRE